MTGTTSDSGSHETEIQLRPGQLVKLQFPDGMIICGETYRLGARPMLRIFSAVKVTTTRANVDNAPEIGIVTK